MLEASSAVIGLLGTVIGGAIAILGATLVQERKRAQRQRALAAAVLTDCERMAAQLPPAETIPFYDPYGSDKTPGWHRWIEPVIVELAGADRQLFATLLEIEPALQARTLSLLNYTTRRNELESHERSQRDFSERIHTAQLEGKQLSNWTSLEGARNAFDEQEARTAPMRSELEKAAESYRLTDRHARRLIEAATGSLTRLLARPIPGVPVASDELSPQHWR